MAWLAGWQHRKTVTITGQAGAGTDYQIDLSIGDAAGGDFHLESHCTSFPNDIQVTDNDQTTPLDYWVEDLTLDPITMWIEVADDLGTNKDICVYYDKSGASTESNISNTMLFGDDFPGVSIDLTKWSGDTGACTVSGGVMVMRGTTDHTWRYIRSLITPTPPLVYQSYAKINVSFGGCAVQLGMRNADSSDFGLFYKDQVGNNKLFQKKDGSETSVASNIIEDAYKDFKIIMDTTGAYFQDDVERTNSPIATDVPVDAMPAMFAKYTFDTIGDILFSKWVFIRNFNDPEPAFSSAGSEESEESAGGRLVYGGLVNAGLIGGRLA